MLYLYSTKQVSPAAPRASPVRKHCGAGCWDRTEDQFVPPLPPERNNLCDIQYVLYCTVYSVYFVTNPQYFQTSFHWK